MEWKTIRLEEDARGVATLTFARPDRLNALTVETMREIHLALDALHGRANLRLLVLAADGRHFTAGGDINMFRHMGKAPAEQRLQAALRGSMLSHRIACLPCPVVARVQGGAFGGGITLIAASDVAIAGAGARFAFTELRRGVVPTAALKALLTRIGTAAYKRYLFTGETFDAAEAQRIGLIDRAVPDGELDGAVDAAVAGCLGAAPGAAAAVKRALDLYDRSGPDALGIDGLYAFAESWANDEGREGAASFLEKRPPAWEV